MNQQPAKPDTHALVPQVVSSYAAYLRARTHLTPEMTVNGDHAEVSVTTAGKALVLTFHHRRREWSLHSAQLRRSDQTAIFACGALAEAVAALLRP